MVNASKTFLIILAFSAISGCVTQNYENSDQPVVVNESSTNEIAMTRISLGLGYLKMGKNSQAKLNLEKAKRIAPNLVQVYIAFAHYYETVGEIKLTTESYEKALDLKPNDADTLNNYGVFLCRNDLLDQAEEQFLKAIKVPTYLLVADSYENLALCQLRADNFEKAEMYLRKSIDHNPSRSSALYQMMLLQYAKGEYLAARAYQQRYEKATRRFSPESLGLAVKIYDKIGDSRGAKNYGEMLVKLYPESWQAIQYILNGLERTDADDLAKRYKNVTQATEPVSKKRVVVLSPKENMNRVAGSSEKQNKAITNASSDADKKVQVLKAPAQPTVVAENKKEFNASNNEKVTPAEPEAIIETQAFIEAKQPVTPSAEMVNETQQTLNSSEELSVETGVEESVATDALLEEELTKLSAAADDSLIEIEPVPTHTIAAGENLFNVSRRYNIHLRSLRAWNNLTEKSILYVGDVIYLADPTVSKTSE